MKKVDACDDVKVEDSHKKQPAGKENQLRDQLRKRPAEYDEQGGSKQLKSRKEQNKLSYRQKEAQMQKLL
ncbi:hypothetical protein F511_28366 [Dorcoceras hygrometricum]|uniref:Uncharacterized protein n=1 Tax=Dorcoceras hygrometricum TaxID=472368 RepID=A0A2Z7B8N9_9LAMI|nr:hypothetical protein F511_28366 [Dorcoceras hygrometricum]